MTRTRSSAVLILVLGALCRTTAAQPTDPAATPTTTVHSIKWLVEEKGKWNGWGAIRRSLTVEGRYSFITPNKLRMQGCPLDFVPPKGEALQRPASRSKNVEVTGRMSTDDGTPVFVVEEIITRPADMTTFRTRRSAVTRTKHEDWYDLAAWAEDRGEFYEDDELRKAGAEARAEGISVEHEAIDGDADELLALATRIEEFDARRAVAFRHEGWRRRWTTLVDADEPPTAEQIESFVERLAKAFPDADEAPADGDDAALIRSYESDPVVTYDRADDAKRKRLHRVFHANAVLRQLLLGVDETARNEEEVADRIEKLIPEHRAEALKLRERALAREVSRVPSMTQREMASLAARFRKAGDPGRAGRVEKDWLAAKEERLRKDGAAGLIEAADFYRSLTGDEDKEAELLIEAHGIRPDDAQLVARIERLGYHLVNGRWTTEAPKAGPDADRGLPRIGMSPEEVTESLGTPRSITRVASSGELTEVWIYGARDAAGFAIHFVRRTAVESDTGRVVKVLTRRPR